MRVHLQLEIYVYISLDTFLSGWWSSLSIKVEQLAYPTYHPTEEFISVLKSYHLKYLKDISGVFTLFSLGGNFHKNTFNVLFPTTYLTCRPSCPLPLPSCYGGRDISPIFPGCSLATLPAFWGFHSESFASPVYGSCSALFQHNPDSDSPLFEIFKRYFMALKLRVWTLAQDLQDLLWSRPAHLSRSFPCHASHCPQPHSIVTFFSVP